MKNLVVVLLCVCMAFLTFACGAFGAGTDLTISSPNKYPAGECTWFADGMAYNNGWTLKFSSKGDAKDWAGRVTNATSSFVPTVRSIMVLGGPTSAGHVSWVTQVTKTSTGYNIVVVHSNWPRGSAYGKVNGKYDYWQHTFAMKTGQKPTVRISGGSVDIPVNGFLKQK